MPKRKTTVYLDGELLRAARVFAARAGIRDSEVVEHALRAYLGMDLLEKIWARSDLGEEEALNLAYEAIHESRTASGGHVTKLTDLEMQVLAHMAFGKTVSDIAEQLRLSEGMISQALESAREKLAPPSRTQRVREVAP